MQQSNLLVETHMDENDRRNYPSTTQNFHFETCYNTFWFHFIALPDNGFPERQGRSCRFFALVLCVQLRPLLVIKSALLNSVSVKLIQHSACFEEYLQFFFQILKFDQKANETLKAA